MADDLEFTGGQKAELLETPTARDRGDTEKTQASNHGWTREAGGGRLVERFSYGPADERSRATHEC